MKIRTRADFAKQRPVSSPKAGAVGGALQSLFTETAALGHRVRLLTRHVHHHTLPHNWRGILLSLEEHGPQTVPHMARARRVSRQHIQVLVNQMTAEGLVEQLDNPAHKRSSLVRLASKGKELIEAANHREWAHLADLENDLSEEEMRLATVVLRKLRELIDRATKEKIKSTKPGSRHTSRAELRTKRKASVPAKPKHPTEPALVAGPPPAPAPLDLEELPISML